MNNAETHRTDLIKLVPRGGIEPPRDYSRRILSPLRLPISPPRQSDIIEDLPIRV